MPTQSLLSNNKVRDDLLNKLKNMSKIYSPPFNQNKYLDYLDKRLHEENKNLRQRLYPARVLHAIFNS